MRVVTRHAVAPEAAEQWLESAELALQVLADRTGFVSGEVAAAVDDASLYLITTRWTSVGDYRRALSHFEVKTHAVPLLYGSMAEPTAFEVLREVVDGAIQRSESARAGDADTVAIRDAAAAEVPGRHSEPR